MSHHYPLIKRNLWIILCLASAIYLNFHAHFGGVTLAQTGDPPLTVHWTSIEIAASHSAAWGDWDNDGDLDLAIGNRMVNQIYENEGGNLIFDPDQGDGWASPDAVDTYSVAWGDWDNDGDLDLAVGNYGQPNQVYENDAGTLKLDPDQGFGWEAPDSAHTYSIAWGDGNNDGYLDLAVGNEGQVNQVFQNSQGTDFILTWESAVFGVPITLETRSIAWGDWNNDSYLDLAVGNYAAFNEVYQNDGTGDLERVWISLNEQNTHSVAWGDYDNDGDFDLAIGNEGSNQVFTNDNGSLQLTLIPDANSTKSVAWGDWDNDGDLDLAAGNGVIGIGESNRLYCYENGSFTPCWTASLQAATLNVAWGDVDGDGDLDLAVANDNQQPNRLYQNNAAPLSLQAPELFSDDENTWHVAWGDVDNDGDLDLATGNGNGQPLRLYSNVGGGVLTSTWASDDQHHTFSLAWGDVDGDGDLDLAAGGPGQPSRLYNNNQGTLLATTVWTTSDAIGASSLAWGDVDGDGDLDLIIGDEGQPIRLYYNEDGVLTDTAGWVSTRHDQTSGLAWGDVDGDGDLDLATGNRDNQPNYLYRNDGGTLTALPVWTSDELNVTASVAWGDMDGDGDLDLAVGNKLGGRSQIYRNEDGMLTTSAYWQSADFDNTFSVAWGDVDGDGDLDLAVGNLGQDERVYCNDGGDFTRCWSLDEFVPPSTIAIAWGDVDGDGDLDLAAGINGTSRIYQNPRRRDLIALNDPPQVVLSRPGTTPDAYFFSTPQVITEANIIIPYTLRDPEGDRVPRIFPEFSPTGGGQWFPATPGSGGDGLIDLAASPTGTPHTFVWQAEKDLIKSDNVVFRIRAQPYISHSPILWPAVDGKSPPFRVAAPTYVKVVDDTGNPVPGAPIFINGELITETVTGLTVTDKAGLLNPGPLSPGTTLATLAQQTEQATVRAQHDGWAYRTHLTNITIDATGEAQAFTVTHPLGEQRLVISPTNTLILVNLLVSIEWDASPAYLADVELAMQKSADFLYDVTDGQMTFGQVAIHDNAAHWSNADIQISAKNMAHPHAYIGGIWSNEPSHLIRVGRAWDGRSGNQGQWSAEAGFRTLVHEFGHYGLGLYDEYFGYIVENDNIIARKDAHCTEPWRDPVSGEIITPPNPETSASIMAWHYETGELADSGRWTAWCMETAQHQLNNSETDWQTVTRLYNDPSGQGRWRLVGPDERAGLGEVVPGPGDVSTALPFPKITTYNAGEDPEPFSVQVCYNDQPYRAGVWITLRKNQGPAMDQGLTDNITGHLKILGAVDADTLQAVSSDGALSVEQEVGDIQEQGFLELAPASQTRGRGTGIYFRLWPTTSNDVLDGIRLVVNDTLPQDTLRYVLTGSDQIGPSAALPYDAVENTHHIIVPFIPTALTGYAYVLGAHDGQFIDLNVDYRLQQANTLSDTHLFSNDGNLSLYAEPGSLPANSVHFLIASPWGLPGPPPVGLTIINEAYEITASDNITSLTKPSILRLRYDLVGSPAFKQDSLTIYRWNFSTATWQPLPSETNRAFQEVTTTITELGLYALMGEPDNEMLQSFDTLNLTNGCGNPALDAKTYVPIVVK